MVTAAAQVVDCTLHRFYHTCSRVSGVSSRMKDAGTSRAVFKIRFLKRFPLAPCGKSNTNLPGQTREMQREGSPVQTENHEPGGQGSWDDSTWAVAALPTRPQRGARPRAEGLSAQLGTGRWSMGADGRHCRLSGVLLNGHPQPLPDTGQGQRGRQGWAGARGRGRAPAVSTPPCTELGETTRPYPGLQEDPPSP